MGLAISHAGNPVVSPSAARYGVSDFKHLATVSKGQCALVTSTAKPYRTFADLIAAAKRGEQPVYAAQSPPTKIVADYIAKVAGVKFRVISVQGGGETMQATSHLGRPRRLRVLGRHAHRLRGRGQDARAGVSGRGAPRYGARRADAEGARLRPGVVRAVRRLGAAASLVVLGAVVAWRGVASKRSLA